MNADAIGITAGQQAGPRCRANRLRHMKVGELAALGGQLVQIGRGETLCAEHADVGITLIVGEDDDDVGQAR